jgi:hypothetical protein
MVGVARSRGEGDADELEHAVGLEHHLTIDVSAARAGCAPRLGRLPPDTRGRCPLSPEAGAPQPPAAPLGRGPVMFRKLRGADWEGWRGHTVRRDRVATERAPPAGFEPATHGLEGRGPGCEADKYGQSTAAILRL